MLERKPQKEKMGSGFEKMGEFGGKTLEHELSLDKIEPKRAGAWAICTLLALGFAATNRAEAQTRYGQTMGQQVRREATREVYRGVGKVMTGIDQAQSRKIQEAGEERSDKLTRLGDYERQLDGDFQSAKITPEKYKLEKARIAQARKDVEKEYKSKVSKIRMKQSVIQSIHRGIRGW